MRHVSIIRLGLAALCSVATLVDSAAALTRHVPAEYATINAALDASAFGDTVLVAPGVYTDVETRNDGTGFLFTSCAFLKDGVVLRSESGPAVTTIDMVQAPGPQPIVIRGALLNSDATVVEGFTVTGVRTSGHGVAIGFSGRVTFRTCVFRDMDAGQSTGAGVVGNGDLAIIDCEFVNCVANAGGGLYHSGGHLEMVGTTFRECGNKAAFLRGDPPDVESAWVERCTFVNNYSNGNSGALHISAYDGGATVIGCHFEENNGDNDAGAIGWGNAGAKTIENCTFVSNGAVGPNAEGGAITISGTGPSTIRGNTFYGNYQVDGSFGGAVLEILTPTLFEHNIIAFASGGTAIAAVAGLVTNCNVFWANSHGPGIPLSDTDREVDPEFCDPTNGDFTVHAHSPCAEPHSEGCGQIGAFPVGCGTISVQPTTWSRIKGRYRTLD